MPILSHPHITDTGDHLMHGHHVQPQGYHHVQSHDQHHSPHHVQHHAQHGHHPGLHEQHQLTHLSKDSVINQTQIGNCDADCVTVKTDTGIDHNNFDVFAKTSLGNYDVTSNIHHTEGIGQTATHGDVCISYKGDAWHGEVCHKF
tara:strand:+ start:917 stop:1351 length:435 start_codon:yes stop_codon:yes gene_type:complete